MKKICSKCGEKKDIGGFFKDKNGKHGVRADCKICNRARRKERYNKNKNMERERSREHNKIYYKKNKEERKKANREYYKKNKEKRKEYYKKWRQENKEHTNAYRKEEYHKKLKHDPLFKLSRLVRNGVNRVTNAVKQDKELRSLEYLGCSLEEFKSHIESLWLDGMSWENHGVDGWHIDHIVPIDWYVKNSDDPWEANHYSNLQPLWAEENLLKGSSI